MNIWTDFEKHRHPDMHASANQAHTQAGDPTDLEWRFTQHAPAQQVGV